MMQTTEIKMDVYKVIVEEKEAKQAIISVAREDAGLAGRKVGELLTIESNNYGGYVVTFAKKP